MNLKSRRACSANLFVTLQSIHAPLPRGVNTSSRDISSTFTHCCHIIALFKPLYRDKLDNMSDEELLRFEFFMRSHFNKNAVMDILKSSLKADPTLPISEEIGIIVGSLSKLFIGELMQTGASINRHFLAC